jgi:hypothetical protein
VAKKAERLRGGGAENTGKEGKRGKIDSRLTNYLWNHEQSVGSVRKAIVTMKTIATIVTGRSVHEPPSTR